jgi:hypothetical protein
MNSQDVLEKANDIIERVIALDAAVSNARAFRALLEDLHSRNIEAVREPHVSAIGMVRAGILRSLILSVTACLDPEDKRRGNRASAGQILDMLEDDAVVRRFPASHEPLEPGLVALERARKEYRMLREGRLLQHARNLRNGAIAHLLVSEKPSDDVSYETLYELHDVAERLVVDLSQVCYRGAPSFPDLRASLAGNAKVFWDTYFKGIGS